MHRRGQSSRGEAEGTGFGQARKITKSNLQEVWHPPIDPLKANDWQGCWNGKPAWRSQERKNFDCR